MEAHLCANKQSPRRRRRRRPSNPLRSGALLIIIIATAARALAYGDEPGDWGPPQPGYPSQYQSPPYWAQQPPMPLPADPQTPPPPETTTTSSPGPDDAPVSVRATALTRLHGACAFGALGACVGKSVSGSLVRPRYALGGLATCGAMHAVGGRFGDLADATGLATVGFRRRGKALALSRTYPVFSQLKAAFGLRERRPFPPDSDDPWRYSGRDPPFSMLRCLVGAVILAGLTTSITPRPPLVPSSLLGILAAAGAIFLVTLRDARGDAARCIVSRAIALAVALWDASTEAKLGAAVAAALRLSGDRLAALDARFGLSQRLGVFMARVMAAAASASSSSGGASSNANARADSSPPPPPPPDSSQQQSNADPLAFYGSGFEFGGGSRPADGASYNNNYGGGQQGAYHRVPPPAGGAAGSSKPPSSRWF